MVSPRSADKRSVSSCRLLPLFPRLIHILRAILVEDRACHFRLRVCVDNHQGTSCLQQLAVEEDIIFRNADIQRLLDFFADLRSSDHSSYPKCRGGTKSCSQNPTDSWT